MQVFLSSKSNGAIPHNERDNDNDVSEDQKMEQKESELTINQRICLFTHTLSPSPRSKPVSPESRGERAREKAKDTPVLFLLLSGFPPLKERLFGLLF
jgi:hypothetical protein